MNCVSIFAVSSKKPRTKRKVHGNHTVISHGSHVFSLSFCDTDFFYLNFISLLFVFIVSHLKVFAGYKEINNNLNEFLVFIGSSVSQAYLLSILCSSLFIFQTL